MFVSYPLGYSGLTGVCLPVGGLAPRHVLDKAATQQGILAPVMTARIPGTALQQGFSRRLDNFPARQGVLVQHLLLHLQNHIRCALPPQQVLQFTVLQSHCATCFLEYRSAHYSFNASATYLQIVTQRNVLGASAGGRCEGVFRGFLGF